MAKATLSTCGMGPCQGRMCAHNAAPVLAAAQQRLVPDVGYPRARFPLKTLTLRQLAEGEDSAD